MMLPGVELARKRRIHNHEIHPWDPQGKTSQPRGPLYSSMAEPALAARIRLEEKLRGAGYSVTPAASSRWSQFMRDGPNTSRQQNSTSSRSNATFQASSNQNITTSINNATASRRVGQVEATQKAALPKSPLLKRLASSADELCAVCLEKVRGEKKVMRLPCSHNYHSDCVLPWLASHPDCPCCRTAVPPTATLS